MFLLVGCALAREKCLRRLVVRYRSIEAVALASLMPVTLLIVDDSRTIRLIIRRCIEQADLGTEEIVEAENGEEALARLSIHNVNLILTGVNMPKMGAVQLLAEMKRNGHWNAIPVLMITTEAGSKPVLDAIHRRACVLAQRELEKRRSPLVQRFRPFGTGIF